MYKITAEIKKDFQDWSSITKFSKKALTEKELINLYESVKVDFDGHYKVKVEIRNFKCERV